MVAGFKSERIEAGNQRRNSFVPSAVGQADIAVDDRERVWVARDAGEEARAEIKHRGLLPARFGRPRQAPRPSRIPPAAEHGSAGMSWPRLPAVIHLCTRVGIVMSMTQIRTALQPAGDLEPARARGDNTPQPIRSLRTGSIISRRAIGWWWSSRALACASTSQPS